MQVGRQVVEGFRLQSGLFLFLPLLVGIGHLFHRLLESLVQVLSMRRDLLLVVVAAVHVQKRLGSVHPVVVLGAEEVDWKVIRQMMRQFQNVVENIAFCKDSG